MSSRRLVRSIRTNHILLVFPHLFSLSSMVHTYPQTIVGTWLVFFISANLTQKILTLFHIGGFSGDGQVLDGFQSAAAFSYSPAAQQRALVNV